MAKADKKQNQLEAWTLDNLSRIAVLSSEDVKAMLPHLMSIPSEYEVYDYLTVRRQNSLFLHKLIQLPRVC
jgi:hypothetical protein